MDIGVQIVETGVQNVDGWVYKKWKQVYTCY